MPTATTFNSPVVEVAPKIEASLSRTARNLVPFGSPTMAARVNKDFKKARDILRAVVAVRGGRGDRFDGELLVVGKGHSGRHVMRLRGMRDRQQMAVSPARGRWIGLAAAPSNADSYANRPLHCITARCEHVSVSLWPRLCPLRAPVTGSRTQLQTSPSRTFPGKSGQVRTRAMSGSFASLDRRSQRAYFRQRVNSGHPEPPSICTSTRPQRQ